MWKVFLKELKEVVRDKKTMFFMILLPLLLFPVIIGGVAYFSSKAAQDAQNKVLKYTLLNAGAAPTLATVIQETEGFEQVELADGIDIRQWVKDEHVDFVLEFPDGFVAQPLASGQHNVQLYYNGAGFNAIKSRLEKLIEPIASEAQKEAFNSLNITEEQQKVLITPISLEEINVADTRENIGEVIGGMVAYVVFILCLQGGMIPAADLGAGEKERGTLETLLISPIDRNKIVFGKFLTIAVAGVTTALITVLSMAIWGVIAGQGLAIEAISNFLVAIDVLDLILVFLMLIPVVAIFSALLLSLSIYAKTFKEAQGYMGPLVVFVIVPVVLAAMPGIELEGVWAWVPLTNVALAMKELIKGTMDYYQLIGIFASTAIIAGLLLGFCVHWFNKEKVLFR